MSRKWLWLTIGAVAVAGFAAGWAVGHQGWVYPRNIVVDVRGDVERPGLYTLHSGSRVVDAIKAAGGMAGRKGRIAGSSAIAVANPEGFVSRAKTLSDGEMIAVDVPQAERWENIPVEEGGTLTPYKPTMSREEAEEVLEAAEAARQRREESLDEWEARILRQEEAARALQYYESEDDQ